MADILRLRAGRNSKQHRGESYVTSAGRKLKQQDQSLLDLTFPGDSEMAGRCREFDWGPTKLGPVETWSACLKVAVGIVLSSRNPMFLFWGPHRVQIYNDAYVPSFGQGGRHPLALGAEGAEFWTDIWETIGPEIDSVMTTGQATWHEDQLIPIERNGRIEEVWWTYGYSPVHGLDGTVEGMLVVCQETTQRIVTERESQHLLASLVTERGRLAALFDKAPSFLALLRGDDLVYERVNAAYAALVGDRELVGKPLTEALPELASQGFVDILKRVQSTGEPFVGKRLPVRLQRIAGAPLETRYVDFVYQRLADLDGGFTVAAHGVDVTEEVSASARLKNSEQRLREQFAKLPVPTLLWEACDDDFVLVEFNEAASAANPVFAPSALGKWGRDLFPNQELVRAEFRRSLRENVVIRRSVEDDSGPGGEVRTIDLTIGPQLPDRVLVHAVDTTERMALESQLRQAQKMEAVGRLAGGVAHDFNNLLTVIGAHSDFLLESLDSDDQRREDAEAIHKAGIRAAGLTRQLLAFSRKQILKPTPVALNAIITETRSMLGRVLGEDIEIVTELAPDLGTVIADATQIDQVLVNLAVNARDAMPSGGRLTLRTRNSVITDQMARVRRDLPAGSYALLEVQDNGSGMPAPTLARLFEPFFTTKAPGKGTGLGLATVYGIVKQSAGYIFADSVLGEGTVFCIYLPAVAPDEEPEQTKPAGAAAVRGVETVLIVEDETAVREITKRVLTRLGYNILEAANGSDALAVSAAYPTVIHIVVTDAVMPGIGGGEVVRLLREQRPGLRALLMSGYTDDEVVRRGIISAEVPFIQKPFALTDFARAVREALDG